MKTIYIAFTVLIMNVLPVSAQYNYPEVPVISYDVASDSLLKKNLPGFRQKFHQDSLRMKGYKFRIPQRQSDKKSFLLPNDSQNFRNYSKTPKTMIRKRARIDYAELDNMPVYLPDDIRMPSGEITSNDNMPNPMLKGKESKKPAE